MKKKINIHANVFLLSMISLLNDVSSEMINPVLPLLIKQLGGSGLAIGLIGGLKESLAHIIKFVGGYGSDCIRKRKPFIVTGYALSSVTKFLLSFAQSWQQAFGFVGLEQIGKGLRKASRDALIAQSVPSNVGLGFGIHRAFDTFGAIIGSIVAVLLLWLYKVPLKSIVFIAAVISLITLVPLYFVAELKNHYDKYTKVTILNPKLKLYIAILSVYGLANFSYMFYILHAQALFSHSYGYVLPMMLYVLYNISYTLFAIPVGILSDRFGRWYLIVTGCLLHGVTLLGIAFSQQLLSVAIFFITYGISAAVMEVVQKSYVADISTDDQKATALGTFFAITGLTTMLSGIGAGLLWDVVSHKIVFVLGSSFCFITVILLVLFRRKIC